MNIKNNDAVSTDPWAAPTFTGRGKAVCLALLVLVLTREARGTDRPVVGVLAQELPEEVKTKYPNKTSYIPAAYVKAVEASGARVAPIFINKTEDYYKHILTSVNGVVFPGGATDFTVPFGFGAAGRIIMSIAEELQDSGVSFPILGVCQGYELLMYLAAKSSSIHDILVDCKSTNSALPLDFRPGFNESRLYRHASEEIIHILRTLPVTSNHHQECVTEEKLKAHHLEKTWRVLSTNRDLQGLEFISSSEHFQRPIAGVQFHPEKNMFEWNPKQANPHSRKAVLSARLFYDWLVTESRANDQSFPSLQEEQSSLMYNFNPEYTGRNNGYDEQVYFF